MILEKLGPPERQPDGGEWQYYVEKKFAVARYIQGTFVLFRSFWETYPMDQNGKVIEMYRSQYLTDPREMREPKS